MKRKVQILAAVSVILASPTSADPLPTSDWPHWERNPSVCQARNASSSWATHGDPVVTGSASPFSTKYDDDVTVATPRGTFVLTRSFVGSRDALGQTDSKSTDSACRGGVVGDRYPGLLKAPFGPNFVPTRSTTQGDLIKPLTIHNLTSIVDTRCSQYTRVLTPQGDTRFFGAAPTVANGQQAWVPRASRAAGEPSRLRVRRSAGGALSFDWFPEGGMRYVFDSVFAASGPNGQYRLTQAYLDDGALFFDVTYAYPLLDPGDPGSSTVKADGGVKPYMWNEPLPGCATCG
ncbi:MAG: hypothetical protein JNM17_32535, partial [Archangium sp.]|nr:hypothetical protein [Archangium sp.]